MLKIMTDFKLVGIDHIQIAMPAGAEDTARRFYCEVLGLVEESKPDALSGQGGLWLKGPGIALHLGVETPFAPARKAHPALIVDDIDKAEDALADHISEARSTLPGMTRFFVCDPFGNRIEILSYDESDGAKTAN